MRIKALVVLLVALALPATLLSADVIEQLTETKTGYFGYYPAMDDAGSLIYVNSNSNQYGDNPQQLYQIFEFDPLTGAGQKLTNFEDGIFLGGRIGFFQAAGHISVSDDGQWIAFISAGNLTGQNHDESPEAFIMRPDGSLLTQLTNDPSPSAGSVLQIALSGSGEWLAYISGSNPLGTNPGELFQVFHMNRDGTGLSQLTTGLGERANLYYLGISDDGQRMVFNHAGDPLGTNPEQNYEVFAIDTAGNLRQLTNSSSGTSLGPVISGNGALVGFHSGVDHLGGNPDGSVEVFLIDWDGGNFRQLTDSTDALGNPQQSRYPSFTDDAQFVYFDSSQNLGFENLDANLEIARMRTDGTELTLLTDTDASLFNLVPVVSGDGSRVSFVTLNGEIAGGNNPDGGYEMNVMSGSGTNMLQLTDHLEQDTVEPDITPDGARIVFTSTANLTGSNSEHLAEVFRMEADGSGLFQVTNVFGAAATSPTIAADGNSIAFDTTGNPLGTNPDGSAEIFFVHADGSSLTQVTSAADNGFSLDPDISADGSSIVFHGTSDLTGGNADRSVEIFKVNPDGTGLVQLTSGPAGEQSAYPRVDQNGTWVVFYGHDDLTGDNADGSLEVFRMRTDGTGLEQLSGNTSLNSRHPDLSGSGDRIVFASETDPLATNPDNNFELFLYEPDTAAFTQFTESVDEDVWWPRISQDGTEIVFISDGEFTEEDPDYPTDIYRVNVASGVIERVGGLRRGYYNAIYPYSAPLSAVSADGQRAVFLGYGDFTESNVDLSSEIFLVDLTRSAEIRVSPGAAPTLVSWDPEARSLRYDIVRGDVENLGFGAGGTIDLGPVLCLEDNSPDADIAGFEDTQTPSVGQAFFYLYRGTQGNEVGAGTYGFGSGSGERIAGAGGCDP